MLQLHKPYPSALPQAASTALIGAVTNTSNLLRILDTECSILMKYELRYKHTFFSSKDQSRNLLEDQRIVRARIPIYTGVLSSVLMERLGRNFWENKEKTKVLMKVPNFEISTC